MSYNASGEGMDKSSIFISYSHKDENWKNRLVTQLRALQLQDSLDLWDDTRIDAGEDWAQEIEKAMTEASVSVLLISADALASKFISSKEIPPLLLRREKKDLRIVPVIVRPCPWKEVEWLASMQVLPKSGTPLDRRTKSDAEADLAAIATEISAIIKKQKKEDEMDKDSTEELTRDFRFDSPLPTPV
jgi:hypothetical protein